MGEYRRVKRCCTPKARVINSYGLSEATIDSTYFEETSDTHTLPSTALVPAGKPFPHATLYVLNEQLQPVLEGQDGEIYIGGEGIASYLNQPSITAERFFPDPNQANGQLYKTGDQGRFLTDGNLEFLGRNLVQVKHNGERIDVSSVEFLLNQHPGVDQALVIPEVTLNNQVYLHCFLTLNDHLLSYRELRKHLRNTFPRLTVLTKFYVTKQLALTANAKVNRKKEAQTVVREIKPEVVAPNHPLQYQLVHLWQNILSVKDIGLAQSFYELGGSSLLFVQMLEEVNQLFKLSLPSTLPVETIQELFNSVQSYA